MATKEKKQIRVIGPKAASWPWINIPETQQNGSTAWTIKVVVEKEEAEKYRALAKQYGDGMIPISKEKENKVETGKFVIKFKRNCNKKDGGAMSPPGLERFNDGNWETGVSFWLEKVRIHKLVEFQTKEDAIEWGDCPDGVPFEMAKVAEPKDDDWDSTDEDF